MNHVIPCTNAGCRALYWVGKGVCCTRPQSRCFFRIVCAIPQPLQSFHRVPGLVNDALLLQPNHQPPRTNTGVGKFDEIVNIPTEDKGDLVHTLAQWDLAKKVKVTAQDGTNSLHHVHCLELVLLPDSPCREIIAWCACN